MKVCTTCNRDYPVPLEDYFSKKKSAKDGLQSECKRCHSDYIKLHYKDNKSYYKDKAAVRNKVVRPQILQFVVDYLKTHPCVDCPEKDPIVLEFDHVRGIKLDNISSMIRNGNSQQAIEVEIAKCEVRCANCHRRKTAKQFNYYKDIQL